MQPIPEWARRARAGWRYRGQERPPFAEVPEEGQESVWDYPRPPRIEEDHREIVVRVGGNEIARSKLSMRVLETASPPTFYLPPAEVRIDLLVPGSGLSRCEWKGQARYWSLVLSDHRLENMAWSYPDPLPGFEAIREYLSFYPARVECYVDGVRVLPQPGGFYGGWVTPDLTGPFKGESGSESW
jgi:uncharacterized protein (DUF427 family)